MLRGLRNFQNMDGQAHHSTNHLKERGAETESSTPRSAMICVQQITTDTVLMATLGRLLRDRAEHVWAFWRGYQAILSRHWKQVYQKSTVRTFACPGVSEPPLVQVRLVESELPLVQVDQHCPNFALSR